MTKQLFRYAFLVVSVLLVARPHSVRAQDDRSGTEILEWLPDCFFGETNVTQMLFCVQENAECYDANTVSEIEECVAAEINLPLPEVPALQDLFNLTNLQDFFQDVADYATAVLDAVGVCLTPYVECVGNNIDDLVALLPPCLNETIIDLAVCGMENIDVCTESCAADLEVWLQSATLNDKVDSMELPSAPTENNPFAFLDTLSLLTCSGVQTEIVEPLCQVVDCCEPCIGAFEAVTECVLHEALDYPEYRFPPVSQVPCTSCTYDYNRRLTASQEQHSPFEYYNPLRILAGEEDQAANQIATNIAELCLTNTPGLTGNEVAPEKELIERGAFFPCVLDTFFGELNTRAATTITETPTESPNDSAAKSISGNALLVLMTTTFLLLSTRVVLGW